MFPKAHRRCTKAALAVTVVGALALPGVAQADTSAGVSAAVKASVRAELHLDSAAQLADDTGARAQARARALLSRSRGELRSAVSRTRGVVASATTPLEVQAAAQAAARISSTLLDDARLQSQIAADGGGRLEAKAAASLIADVRLQQAVVTDVLDVAPEQTGARVDDMLKASADAVRALSGQVDVSAKIAASADVAASARASADMAVAIGTDALAMTAAQLATVETQIGATAQVAADGVRGLLADVAGQIAARVEDLSIDAHSVTLVSHGLISLGALANIGVRSTASLSLNAGHAGAQADAAGQAAPGGGGLLGGLLGVRR